MKNILIETCLTDLFLAAIENDQVISYIHIKNLQKKADSISDEYMKLITKVKWDPTEINSFYVTKGPGSFMGARVGLLFARTMCQIIGAELYAVDTLSFISTNKTGAYHIDAKGERFFTLTIDRQGNKTYSIEEGVKETKVNYKKIIKDIPSLLAQFKREHLEKVSPYYMKEPKVGA